MLCLCRSACASVRLSVVASHWIALLANPDEIRPSSVVGHWARLDQPWAPFDQGVANLRDSATWLGSTNVVSKLGLDSAHVRIDFANNPCGPISLLRPNPNPVESRTNLVEASPLSVSNLARAW